MTRHSQIWHLKGFQASGCKKTATLRWFKSIYILQINISMLWNFRSSSHSSPLKCKLFLFSAYFPSTCQHKWPYFLFAFVKIVLCHNYMWICKTEQWLSSDLNEELKTVGNNNGELCFHSSILTCCFIRNTCSSSAASSLSWTNCWKSILLIEVLKWKPDVSHIWIKKINTFRFGALQY